MQPRPERRLHPRVSYEERLGLATCRRRRASYQDRRSARRDSRASGASPETHSTLVGTVRSAKPSPAGTSSVLADPTIRMDVTGCATSEPRLPARPRGAAPGKTGLLVRGDSHAKPPTPELAAVSATREETRPARGARGKGPFACPAASTDASIGPRVLSGPVRPAEHPCRPEIASATSASLSTEGSGVTSTGAPLAAPSASRASQESRPASLFSLSSPITSASAAPSSSGVTAQRDTPRATRAGIPRGLPSVPIEPARRLAVPADVSSAQTHKAPLAVGTMSAHTMWSLVRWTSAGLSRAVLSRREVDDRQRLAAVEESRPRRRAIPWAWWVGRTTSDVASRGTGVTTCGLRSGAPSSPIGTTTSSASPVRSDVATHAASPPSFATPGQERPDGRFRDGPQPVGLRRGMLVPRSLPWAPPRAERFSVIAGLRRIPRAAARHACSRTRRPKATAETATTQRHTMATCALVTDGTTREAARTVPASSAADGHSGPKESRDVSLLPVDRAPVVAELGLPRLELRRVQVHATEAAAARNHVVEHLVVDDVADEVAGHPFAVERRGARGSACLPDCSCRSLIVLRARRRASRRHACPM